MKENRLLTVPPTNIMPCGMIQFIHGMCEHKERYLDTMRYFSENGYICIISDLPGHGENIHSTEEYGYIGKNGVQSLIDCVHQNTLFLKEHFRNIPYTLFGHSMGSLICRAYLKTYDRYVDTAFICGSPSDHLLKAAALPLLDALISIFGEKAKSTLIQNFMNEQFEKPFDEDIPYAWISSDIQVVEKFNHDEKCNFTYTLNGYQTLLKLMKAVYTDTGWTLSHSSLPIYFISGEKDPCMIDQKHFEDSVAFLKCIGYTNIYSNIFPEMRHELLNEQHKDIVLHYILTHLPKE